MNRRAFLASGVAAAGQSAPASGRIDCQSHLFCPELLALLEKRKNSPYAYRKGPDLYVTIEGWHRRVLPKHTDVGAKLSDMDAAGIEKTALSVNDPGPELFAKDGPAIARLLNDYIADLVSAIRPTSSASVFSPCKTRTRPWPSSSAA